MNSNIIMIYVTFRLTNTKFNKISAQKMQHKFNFLIFHDIIFNLYPYFQHSFLIQNFCKKITFRFFLDKNLPKGNGNKVLVKYYELKTSKD